MSTPPGVRCWPTCRRPALYTKLLPQGSVPARLIDELENFDWDLGTVKIDYALAGPVPWRAAAASEAGTVHVGADLDDEGKPIGAVEGLVRWNADLRSRRVPVAPFGLTGQMTTTDPTRSPAGTESFWAYTHVPKGMADDATADQVAVNMEKVLERHAPGFRDLVLDRVVQRPSDLQSNDANLVGGAVNGGTSQLHQQLVFRPTPGPGGSRTAVDGLYLASAATHPGGGVHGACGYLAARAALRDTAPVLGPLRRRASSAVLDLLYRESSSTR
jgi:phytoene dehydrogenase-like protein